MKIYWRFLMQIIISSQLAMILYSFFHFLHFLSLFCKFKILLIIHICRFWMLVNTVLKHALWITPVILMLWCRSGSYSVFFILCIADPQYYLIVVARNLFTSLGRWEMSFMWDSSPNVILVPALKSQSITSTFCSASSFCFDLLKLEPIYMLQ